LHIVDVLFLNLPRITGRILRCHKHDKDAEKPPSDSFHIAKIRKISETRMAITQKKKRIRFAAYPLLV